MKSVVFHLRFVDVSNARNDGCEWFFSKKILKFKIYNRYSRNSTSRFRCRHSVVITMIKKVGILFYVVGSYATFRNDWDWWALLLIRETTG